MLGRQYGKEIFGNFIEGEMPFIPADATLVTIFAGANDVNVITAALGGGAAGSGDRGAYIDQQVRNFGNDFTTLLAGIRDDGRVAPAIIVLEPAEHRGDAVSARNPRWPERQAAQRASVRMTTTVINTLPETSPSSI